MNPFHDPTRPESGPMDLDAYSRMSGQRQWDDHHDYHAAPARWIEGSGPFVCALVLVVAVSLCVLAWGWPWI